MDDKRVEEDLDIDEDFKDTEDCSSVVKPDFNDDALVEDDFCFSDGLLNIFGVDLIDDEDDTTIGSDELSFDSGLDDTPKILSDDDILSVYLSYRDIK